ncbi:MAG: hypothetical protein FJW34_25525 [Acidobacteria bacterium]|nr:hypothetical protein [Acidobacteriota bacterium]
MPLSPGPDGRRKLVVSSLHLAHHPSQVVVLSHRGAILGEYWHSGHLNQMDLADLNGDGTEEILLAGISNGYHCATLVVLDPGDLGGASIEENPDYQLQGFAPGREKTRLLFPRTCINRKLYQYNWPNGVDFSGGRIKVTVREREHVLDPAILYYFDRQLRLIGLEVSDAFRGLHRELEAAGQLDHPLTEKEINELRNIRHLKRPAW